MFVNYDEKNVVNDPGKTKVIVRWTSRQAHRVLDSSRSSHSIMFAGSASSNLLPVYFVFHSDDLYDTWTTDGPSRAQYNMSKSGWFDGQIYEDWFKSVLLPYFKRKDPSNKKWKVVLGDNLASHLNVHVLKLCEANKIKFIFLPPNYTGL